MIILGRGGLPIQGNSLWKKMQKNRALNLIEQCRLHPHAVVFGWKQAEENITTTCTSWFLGLTKWPGPMYIRLLMLALLSDTLVNRKTSLFPLLSLNIWKDILYFIVLINMNLSENDTKVNITEENLALWVLFINSRCRTQI